MSIHLQTKIKDTDFEKFRIFMEEKKIKSRSDALRILIQEHFSEPPLDPNNVSFTYDENTDVEYFKKYPKKDLDKLLDKFIEYGKTKNILARHGSYHDQMALKDVQKLVNKGNPSFSELVFHVNYWYQSGIIAKARTSKPNCRQMVRSFVQSNVGLHGLMYGQ